MAALTPEQKLEGVRALLNPRNVAIVGASDRPGNWSLRVFQMLRRFGFPGAIYAVNPRNQTVWNGELCYPSLMELPEKPDHVVVIVPGAAAIGAVADAGKAGARSATVFTGGFGEGGDPMGRELAARLKRAIEESGLAVSGPNCLGNLAAPDKFITIPDDRIPDLEPGPVAVLRPERRHRDGDPARAGARGMRTSYALTTGNELGLYTSDYIRYLAGEPQVKAIACFIESIRHPAEFRSACEFARDAGKPVVAVKIGGSEESRKAALAHTGSLAGSLDCFDAVAETVGVIRVDTLDEMVESGRVFRARAAAERPAARRHDLLRRHEGHDAGGGRAPRPVVPAAVAGHACEARRRARRRHLARQSARRGLRRALERRSLFQMHRASACRPEYRCAARAGGAAAAGAPKQQGRQPAPGNRMVEDKGPPVAVMSMISYMLSEHSRAFRAELTNLPVLQEIDKSLKAVGAAGRYGALRAQASAPAGASARKPDIRPILKRATRPATACRCCRGRFQGAHPRLRHPHAERDDRRQP